jgi:dTDP-4-amino-4,6-dideoxygalactose transaminase
VPVHRQPAYTQGAVVAHDLATTDALAPQILSLPMYPTLTTAQVLQVAAAVATALEDAIGPGTP